MLYTHVIVQELLGNWIHGEPIVIINFVIDTIINKKKELQLVLVAQHNHGGQENLHSCTS